MDIYFSSTVIIPIAISAAKEKKDYQYLQ